MRTQIEIVRDILAGEMGGTVNERAIAFVETLGCLDLEICAKDKTGRVGTSTNKPMPKCLCDSCASEQDCDPRAEFQIAAIECIDYELRSGTSA